MSVREHIAHHTEHIRKKVSERRLFFALIFAISGALILTITSVTIYNVGGFYRYDLSRPGFEKERQELATSPTDVTYDTTSPLTQQAVTTFLKQLDEHRQNLNTYDTFGDSSLNDEDLELMPTPPAQ